MAIDHTLAVEGKEIERTKFVDRMSTAAQLKSTSNVSKANENAFSAVRSVGTG